MAHIRNRALEVPPAAGVTFGSTITRAPMNARDFDKSAAVMAWLSPTGETRSLPTNIRDLPRTINQTAAVQNGLRSVRHFSYTDPLPEGGRSFAVGVNVDNFVEERRDRSHKSGSVPAIVRCTGMYKTEYMDRTNEARDDYRQLLAADGLVAKVPQPGQDYRNSSRIGYNSNYLQYAGDGFARGVKAAHADATIPMKQGSAWVGTAPASMYQSLNQTQQARQKAEFQKIHPSADGRTKVVITCTEGGKPLPGPLLDAAMATAKLSEQHGTHWQTMYKTEICKEPRR